MCRRHPCTEACDSTLHFCSRLAGAAPTVGDPVHGVGLTQQKDPVFGVPIHVHIEPGAVSVLAQTEVVGLGGEAEVGVGVGVGVEFVFGFGFGFGFGVGVGV